MIFARMKQALIVLASGALLFGVMLHQHASSGQRQ
jgi:hypothetical protein